MSRRLTPTIRVLLVEDHEVVREGLRALLERDPDISVIGDVGTASAAIEAARELSPHVVVMDIGMPRMDGYEAIRRIRALPDASDILAIALTGWGQDSAVRQAEEAGFNHHVVKPVNFGTLKKLLT